MARHGGMHAHDNPQPTDAPTFAGSPETFSTILSERSPSAAFQQAGVMSLRSVTLTAPQPSAVVIQTTDAFGHATQALATLPAIAESQGIYRPIDPAGIVSPDVV